jgi:hypothetical protein
VPLVTVSTGPPANRVRRARSQAQVRAEATFRARLAELGATLLEPYKDTRHPHRVRCAAGHECRPRPSSVQQGQGICQTCAQRDPAATEAAFRARLTQLGATLLEPYKSNNHPHRVRCAAGHKCSPQPKSVRRGLGICQICAGNDTATAEAAFRARLAELGATLLEPYGGTHHPHGVRCALGHECRPRPADVQRGAGICRVCAGKDPATAEAAFRTRLAEAGATLLEPYKNTGHPHRVQCGAGHECFPRPSDVQQGWGICRACARQDPAVAEAAFRARLEELGAVLLEPAWLGACTPHRVRCASGHECYPQPHNVQRGSGICRVCAGKSWDVFYVVADQDAGRIKFGITSGNPRPRLATHRRSGYREVIRVLIQLPDTTAPDIERAVLAALRLAGIQPIRGREYYDADALALVLDVTDNYPVPRRVASSIAA